MRDVVITLVLASCLVSATVAVVKRKWQDALLVSLTVCGLLGIASPIAGVNGSPHCRSHLMTGHESVPVSVAPDRVLAPPVWLDTRGGGCHHCPAPDCRSMVACTSLTLSAVPPAKAALVQLPGRRVTLESADVTFSSTASSPDTRPPQPIA